MVNADVPSTTAATARRPIAAPLSPPFPVRQAPPSTTTMTSSRRPTSSLTVVQRDSDPVPSSSRPLPGSGSGARLSPADFAAAQREAAARVAAKEEARYEALRRESERRAVESLKVVDLVALLSEPGVSREVMKDVARRGLRSFQYVSDVIPERQSLSLCAYPGCSRPPRRPLASTSSHPSLPATPQLRLDFNSRRVVDFKERGKYCGDKCMRRSEWYEKQVLAREAEWARPKRAAGQNDEDELLLLEELEERGAVPPLASPPPPPASGTSTTAPPTQAFSDLTIRENPASNGEIPRPPSPSQPPPTESFAPSRRKRPRRQTPGNASASASGPPASTAAAASSLDNLPFDLASSSSSLGSDLRDGISSLLSGQAAIAHAKSFPPISPADREPEDEDGEGEEAETIGAYIKRMRAQETPDEARALDEALQLRNELMESGAFDK